MVELALPTIIIAQVVSLLVLVRSQWKLNAAHKLEIEAKDELTEAQEGLITARGARLVVLEKLACCGCGHSLGRHDDPDSADGYGCRDCNCQAVHNLVDTIQRPRRN